MDIPSMLPYIQFFGQIALIAAAVFAGYQFMLHRRERTDTAALQVLTHLQSAEFRAAYARIWSLPLNATSEEVRAGGREMEDAAGCVAMTFEVLGVMVHNRIVPLEVVDQAIGGFARESWRRLKPYYDWRRAEVGSRRVAEWYQWLAEHLAVETRRGEGAYVAFSDWHA